jgi:hypothetical protein
VLWIPPTPLTQIVWERKENDVSARALWQQLGELRAVRASDSSLWPYGEMVSLHCRWWWLPATARSSFSCWVRGGSGNGHRHRSARGGTPY